MQHDPACAYAVAFCKLSCSADVDTTTITKSIIIMAFLNDAQSVYAPYTYSATHKLCDQAKYYQWLVCKEQSTSLHGAQKTHTPLTGNWKSRIGNALGSRVDEKSFSGEWMRLHQLLRVKIARSRVWSCLSCRLWNQFVPWRHRHNFRRCYNFIALPGRC